MLFLKVAYTIIWAERGGLSVFDSHHIFFWTLILKQKWSHINIGKGKAKYCFIVVNKNMHQPQVQSQDKFSMALNITALGYCSNTMIEIIINPSSRTHFSSSIIVKRF